MVELGTRLAYRKSECRKLSTYGCARRISTRRGGGEAARGLRAVGAGDRREAKGSTGLGTSPRPGSQGGLRTRGPWWNEAPTSRIERARAGNAPPQVVRAAVLSRPLGPCKLRGSGRSKTSQRVNAKEDT